MLRLSLATLLLTSILAAACGDGTSSAAFSSPVVLDDYATVMPDGLLPADLCARIPAADNVQLLCTDNDFCGTGGLCVQPPGAIQGQCSQACFPEPPTDVIFPQGWDASFTGCGNSCTGDEICATLTNSDGSPILLDLNVDGTPDVVGGSCQSGGSGQNGAYEECGDAGLCAEGNLCLTSPGRETGTCFPACTTTCENVGDYVARCSFSSAGEDVCLVGCDLANPASCPQGLSCVENARGNAVCVR
jgi:hypothetical protein